MHIIARRTLVEYWSRVPETKSELEAWFSEAEAAHWATPVDVKAKYGNASILKDGRVVFNVRGNTYRLIVHIQYQKHIVYIRFIGTHREYDQINANTI